MQRLGYNRSYASPCENCGGPSGIGIGSFRVLKFSLVRIVPPILHPVIRATSERILKIFKGRTVVSEFQSNGIEFILFVFRFRGIVQFNKKCKCTLKTTLFYRTDQLHVSANDVSRHHAYHRSIKTKCLQAYWWLKIYP